MQQIKYIALGDSYTIGEGAKPEESWPNLLVNELSKLGLDIELVANPSVTGWTTQDLIDKELPVFDRTKSNFASVLIGVNDWVQEVPKAKFQENLIFIMDHIQNMFADQGKILMVNIPDFGVTPEGPKYSKGRDISAGLMEFNKVIEEQALKRNLPLADIFWLSKEMGNDPMLVASDGLHPSAIEYRRWEPVIREKALTILP